MFSPTIRSLKRTCVCRLKRPLDYTLTIKIATTQNEDISALAYATALFVSGSSERGLSEKTTV